MTTTVGSQNTLFSIITPVFNPPEAAFRACIDSVLNQAYETWEWCLADDGSTEPYVEALLRMAEADSRVKVTRAASNGGIVAASNRAAHLSTGEFVCLLDHDDVLTQHALATVAATVDEFPDADYVYSDEDKIDVDGNRYDRFCKPDWSPERLLGQNYCSHLSTIRRSIFEQVGGFRTGFDGSQDYDLVLRVIERARRVVHIPDVLYHWRAVSGSTASDFDAKPQAFTAALDAIRGHLDRTGQQGEVEQTASGYYRVRRPLIGTPKVSIIMPTRGSSKPIWGRTTCLATNAVRSIVEQSTYENYEVVLVHDSSTPDCELEAIQRLLGERLIAVEYPHEFDFADKTNRGVVRSSGDVVLMLNDDTQVVTPDWIETLLGHLSVPDVGMVGPLLLLADGRVQSAGHYNDRTPHNLGAGALPSQGGPFGMFAVAGERTGLTAACAALRREVYDEVGGLSTTFPKSFNDVDLGFKLLSRGYRLIWTPFAKLYHFESLTRDPTVSDDEVDAMFDRWGIMLEREPYAKGIDQWWTSMSI
jgi:glycosyltransferase involved in cell wall biosynthesis